MHMHILGSNQQYTLLFTLWKFGQWLGQTRGPGKRATSVKQGGTMFAPKMQLTQSGAAFANESPAGSVWDVT